MTQLQTSFAPRQPTAPEPGFQRPASPGCLLSGLAQLGPHQPLRESLPADRRPLGRKRLVAAGQGLHRRHRAVPRRG